MNIYYDIRCSECKLFIVDAIQGRCIKATHVNQIFTTSIQLIKTSGWHNTKTVKPHCLLWAWPYGTTNPSKHTAKYHKYIKKLGIFN